MSEIPYYLIALVSLLEDYDIGSLGRVTGGDIGFLIFSHCQSLLWQINSFMFFLDVCANTGDFPGGSVVKNLPAYIGD